MKEKLILSIIVPVYGVEKFIERCSRSLFEQTILKQYRVEFIFVNDCTKDDSIQVLENVINDYPQLKEFVNIINLKSNEGLFMARHYGLMQAKGKYIAHIDSDDYVDITMFEKMIEIAENKQLDMVWCGLVKEKKNGEHIHFGLYKYNTPSDFLRHAIHDERIWCVWGKIYRREIAMLAENMVPLERINFAEDLFRTALMLLSCKSCEPVHEELYHYCENLTSISSSQKTRDFFPDMVKIGNHLESILPSCYSLEVKQYKQLVLWKAITLHTPSTYKLYNHIWPNERKSTYLGAKYSYRCIYRIASISFPVAAWIWKNVMPLYMKLLGKGKLIK